MRKNRTKSRNEIALDVESLETRRLRAGIVGPLAQGVQVIAQPFTPATDLAYAHDVLSLTGVGQTVVIIDSGIAYDHYALGSGFGTSYRVVGGWDFTENDADPYDDGPLGYHGTHVAGIVGSSDSQFPGLAPEVDLVALRVFDDTGHGDFDWIESALAWVHSYRNSFENPITTVNLSIGSGVNSDTVPDWTELEDELKILSDDGIFVAVAAGNGFREFGVAGLNYPAASPFVIPVASVNDAGQLSEFSQRHQRVLAAPGELVKSTVPDYLYGFDGVTDDFARSTGTSMATPFVAGASVLVREAYSSIGRDDVPSDEIYRHLMETADLVSDPVTNAEYHRINLRAALDSIMMAPRPPLGSSAALKSLGTIDEVSFASSGDEWFEFTAAETAVMLINSDGSEPRSTISVYNDDQRLDGEVTSGNGAIESRFVTVSQGQRYQIHVPASVDEVHFQPLFSLYGDTIDVYGDRSDQDIYVSIGPAFVVVARDVREQVDTAERLQDTVPDFVEVEHTSRGWNVRVGVSTAMDGSRIGSTHETTSIPSSANATNVSVHSPLPQSFGLPTDLPTTASMIVGFHTNRFADQSLLSEQVADATFAASERDATSVRPQMTQSLVDDLYSEDRYSNFDASSDARLLPLPSDLSEDDLVDQFMREKRMRFHR